MTNLPNMPIPQQEPASQPGQAGSAQETTFLSEVQEVRTYLENAFVELDSALRHFVRKDLAAAEPFPLAVVILSAGLPVQDAPEVHERRVFLAAALEMLRIALTIHEALVVSRAPSQAEKSLVGATILVGDYCFSHSATLAARTNSPYVVEVFSKALKSVSEGRLRSLFSADGQTVEPYGEQEELCVAGAQAAVHLAGIASPQSQQLVSAAALVGQTLDRHERPDPLYERIVQLGIPAHQTARWRQALAYLAAEKIAADPFGAASGKIYTNGSGGGALG